MKMMRHSKSSATTSALTLLLLACLGVSPAIAQMETGCVTTDCHSDMGERVWHE